MGHWWSRPLPEYKFQYVIVFHWGIVIHEEETFGTALVVATTLPRLPTRPRWLLHEAAAAANKKFTGR